MNTIIYSSTFVVKKTGTYLQKLIVMVTTTNLYYFHYSINQFRAKTNMHAIHAIHAIHIYQ